MIFIQFLQSNLKPLMKLLENKKGQERSINDQIAFIESLIQKLALEIVEEKITSHEKSFLICLFIELKRNELKTNVPILDEYQKKIELMLEIVNISLYRYISIHKFLAFIVVRRDNQNLYETTWPSGVSWDVKLESKKEFYGLLGKVGIDAKEDCTDYRDYFRNLISKFEFTQLQSELLEFSAQFEKFRPTFSSTDDDAQDLDSLTSLLALLLEFESKFLSEKEKFLFFEKKFKDFQKQTQAVLQEILDKDYEYEMRGCGDSEFRMRNTPYTVPFAEIRILIETMNAVLSNECQKDCGCHFPNSVWSSPQFTHKPIVLTPEMKQKIGQCSAELKELLE
jgi:hypothetical protein